jgi:hypothetical protein
MVVGGKPVLDRMANHLALMGSLQAKETFLQGRVPEVDRFQLGRRCGHYPESCDRSAEERYRRNLLEILQRMQTGGANGFLDSRDRKSVR